MQDVTAWRLGKIEVALDAVLVKLDDRPDWKDVRNIEDQLAARITRLEDWQTWAIRIVVGAVLVALVGVALAVGKV
ncbi:hypothetical protein QEX66_gp18 [Arthrobacter phage Corgi]|uniref:Uncharacterized protein n=1 Tax=Arthrobacter phage Corgi TaxID=2419952 RepID=A0A3G2KF13_9CAUD|nr:hypothetical protein QEX66_gp18 [Arthrobacter phage Corgi]AYN57566.1 hypothetical protein PBI_CORGI_18 [Arthrobacter phage Corgi]